MISNDIINTILSKTQKKTPTIIHKHFSIQRIRKFYIKKLSFAYYNFYNYICNLIQKFPVMNEIDPFFKNIFNLLFNKNYYKVALGWLNNLKLLIFKLLKKYTTLLKLGNSLQDCKILKKVGLGKLCSMVKKTNSIFIYLKKVEIQIKFIPFINFHKKLILLSGGLGSGKSSLLNKITKANVKTNSYAFVTKFLQIGEYNNNCTTWQLLDTPGLKHIKNLNRNSVEMQTIVALIHLKYTNLHVFDFSFFSKVNMIKQIDIFKSILCYLTKKKIIILLNKTDLNWEKTKNRMKKALIFYILKIKKEGILKLSCHDETGIFFLQKTCLTGENHHMLKPKQISFFLYFKNTFILKYHFSQKVTSKKKIILKQKMICFGKNLN
ncbi:nucleolar G-protein (nucleomorph) [Cryptomonas paramecium]|uniref:Nucleolar G-protein n=1 Tax=Cryptomonas paramaecium TaxID=2898 RepID=F2HI16_9CRYP|nr:nucleolar G-protein [Cryptomonas paramecium]AEA38962.1 nucleolar G-protein [Cryptomonas paramecium]